MYVLKVDNIISMILFINIFLQVYDQDIANLPKISEKKIMIYQNYCPNIVQVIQWKFIKEVTKYKTIG